MIKKKLILVISIISILLVILVEVVEGKSNSITPEDAIEKINENYFDIKLNVAEKKAIVDGNELELTDLLSVSESELDNMINDDNLNDYLDENLVGDIDYTDNSITISNPYSTDTLIIQTEDKNVFEKYDEISSTKEIADNIYIVNFDNAEDTKNGYEELQKDKEVINVLKDKKVHKLDNNLNTKSVSESNMAWGVATTGMGHYSTKIDYSDNDKEVKVAVLDTGINQSHEAFKKSQIADRLDMEKSYDYVNDDADPTDDDGHGTAVAGVIAESTPKNIKIVSMKVMDENGEGYFSDIMQAIDDTYTEVDVINLSLGTALSEFSEDDLTILEAFFEKVYDAKCIVVCAAGNEHSAVSYPGASAYTLCASAINSSGNFASSFSNYGDEVDFALPGVNLTLPDYEGNTSYTTMSGTSFSCPFLASAVALVKTDYNYTEIDDIVNVLKENAVDSGDSGKDVRYGYGSINFGEFMFKSPVIANIKAIDQTWGLENTIQLKAVSASKIKSYALTINSTTPTSWNNLTTPVNNLELELKTNTNGVNNVWLKNEDGNISNKQVTVSYVDVQAPNITSFSQNGVTENSINVRLITQDVSSGIANIKWYIKKSNDLEYTKTTEDCRINGNGNTNVLTKNHLFSGLEANTVYNMYATITDNLGNSINTSVINVTTSIITKNISIENKTNGLANVKIAGQESTNDFSVNTSYENFSVSCIKPCVIILVNELTDTYTTLNATATANENEYEFSYDLDNLKFVIALKGDVNLNGTVNAADSMLVNRSIILNTNPAHFELSNIQQKVADINKNETVDLSDSNLIDRALISNSSEQFFAFEW